MLTRVIAGQRDPAVGGQAVVRHPAVARPWVGAGDAQRADRTAAEGGRGVDRLTGRDPGETPGGTGAQVARSLRHHGDVGAQHVPGREQSTVDGGRLQVAAERLSHGHHAGQVPGQPVEGTGEPRRQCRAVGHHVGDPGPGCVRAYPGHDRRQRRVQVGGHHRHPAHILHCGQ